VLGEELGQIVEEEEEEKEDAGWGLPQVP